MNRRELLLGGSLAAYCLKTRPFVPDPPTYPIRPLENVRVEIKLLPLGITTARLRDIHRDADGYAWIGANEPDRCVPVVNLKTGTCRRVPMRLGEGQYLDMLLPYRDKIVVCGGGYEKQVFLHRKTGKQTEQPLQAARPLIYGGLIAAPYAYLFDSRNGIYRWDISAETARFYPFAGKGTPLVGGRYVPQKRAIYGVSWWQEGMPPSVPLVKFDAETERYAGEFVPPWPETRTMAPVQVGDKLYATDMFGGTIMVFDLKTEQWTARYRLPGYRETWVYTTACTALGPYLFCNTSTFAGTKGAEGTYGFDGKPHHFVNRVLIFDTRTGAALSVEIPALTPDGYATLAYMQAIEGAVYGTCVSSAWRTEGTPTEQGAAYLVRLTLQAGRAEKEGRRG